MQISYFKKPSRKIPDSLLLTDDFKNVVEIPIKRIQVKGRGKKVNPYLLGIRFVNGYSFTKDRASLLGIASHDGTIFELYENKRGQQAIFYINENVLGCVRLRSQAGTQYTFK